MKKKVLVVDDSKKWRNEVTLSLGTQFDIEYAFNGSEGLYKLSQKTFDLVILDHIMHDMNGVEMLESFRKNKRLNSKPIVIMYTTECDPMIKAKGIQAGVHFWIIKPINNLGLGQIVQEIFYRIDNSTDYLKSLTEKGKAS